MQDGAVLASLRTENRYAVDDFQVTRISVAVPTADGEPNHYEAFLADLSLRGVRLARPVKLLSGQKVVLRLALPAIEVDWTREATVVWTDPRDAESWWIGCSLNEPLEHETIDRMAVAQIVDRRRDSRYAVAELAQIRWELSEDVRDVQVVNFSKGGFCVVGPDDATIPSERVMLLLEQDDRRTKVPARVMWNRPTSDGHALGCAFTTRDGFVRLREFLEPDGSPRGAQLASLWWQGTSDPLGCSGRRGAVHRRVPATRRGTASALASRPRVVRGPRDRTDPGRMAGRLDRDPARRTLVFRRLNQRSVEASELANTVDQPSPPILRSGRGPLFPSSRRWPKPRWAWRNHRFPLSWSVAGGGRESTKESWNDAAVACCRD